MSSLSKLLLFVFSTAGVNLSINICMAQNAEWKEGQYPGHESVTPDTQKETPANPQKSDNGQRKDEGLEGRQSQAGPTKGDQDTPGQVRNTTGEKKTTEYQV